MSASEKKAQRRAERDEQRHKDEQKNSRSTLLYSAVAAVVVIAAVVLMVWNTGLLQRNLTALTVGGVKYTMPEVQYYYTTLYNDQANSYAFDSSVSVKKQVYDQATGQSWHDHLIDLAIQDLTATTALAAKAESEGYTLSEEAQASLDSTLNQLDTMWVGYGATSREAFIRSRFGAYMTYDKLAGLMKREILANDYANSQVQAVPHADSEYETYYQENKDDLDTIIYTQLAFQAAVPTVDSEGNPVEMTDEEKSAALEEAKTAKRALAEEVKGKLGAGQNAEDLAEEYAGDLYSSALSRRASGRNVSASIYADWLMDTSRRAGDVAIQEQDTGENYYYYVAVFEERFRDEEATHSVRHLLVRAQGDVNTSTPTQAQYDVAEEKAKAFLDEWKSGEATNASFAQLASQNTDDTSSASSGGLISGITSTSSYVESFRDWACDPSRKEGDTELVKSEYGWHVMYYVSTDDPTWKLTAVSAIQLEDLEQVRTDATQGVTASKGAGMNFVGA